MLDFNSLLDLAELKPSETLIVRHVPVEKDLRKVLPWLVVERPDLWLAYQRIQWRTLEKAMTGARYVASFIGQEKTTATFAGLHRIGKHEVLDFEGYRSFPGNRELEELGMTGRDESMPDCLAFELDLLDTYRDWIGRLTIGWPKPDRQWWRWGGRGEFPVETIEAENRFVRGMPEWNDLVLRWHELQFMPASWKAALVQWRGVYLIFDTVRLSGYVGSASGSENLLGRWSDYAKSGHGGNRELRKSDPSNLVFSILQLTSPDLEVAEVVALETSWKKRLHTQSHGLNAN